MTGTLHNDGGRPAHLRAFAALARMLDTLLLWQERHRERRNLAMLGEHILKDIGVSRADIELETSKTFWRR
jgi:uncharacterized protein YjiS (DUF1127 family)